MTLTEKAATHLKIAMENDSLSPDNTFIRMGVKGGGCSGFTYTLDFDNKIRKFDINNRRFDTNQFNTNINNIYSNI